MHLTAIQCADAVRGALAGEERQVVEEHAGECRECDDLLRFWQQVSQLAEADAAFEPPADAVVTAKALAVRLPAPEPGALSRLIARAQSIMPALAFDTFEHALPAGVRTSAIAVRQLVYQMPALSIDLRLEATGRGGRIVMAGQIGTPVDAPLRGPGATVAVVQKLTELAMSSANEFGEFHCEFDAGKDLVLSISLEDGSEITIPLDRLPIE